MNEWLAEHGLELALALVSVAWYVSRTLVNFGEWRGRHVRPNTDDVIRQATHAARNLILKDLEGIVSRIEKKVDDGSAKSSEMWGKVQTRIGTLEVQMAKVETRQEQRE